VSIQACTTDSPAGGPAATVSASAPSPPISAVLNQFRDNYSKRIIEIQLTNHTGEPVTVRSATVESSLFNSGISWRSPGSGTELPPGQTKSLPAQLPDPVCFPGRDTSTNTVNAPAALRITTDPDSGTTASLVPDDPYGVLARNNSELCFERLVGELAQFSMSPELEVAPDGRTAVVTILIGHQAAGTNPGAEGSPRILSLDNVSGTTLIAEDPARPWPSGVQLTSTGPPQELKLSIRPARCDPHAVAEDKVGTLIPLHLTVDGLGGVLKVDAGTELRGRIHDFVSSACGPR